MQDIEKNMDDLFRKAVENYQPNPGESHWQQISSKLSAKPAIPPSVKEKNNIKNYLLILWFLLLFLLAGELLTKYKEKQISIPVLSGPSKERRNIDKANITFKNKSEEAQL